MGLFDFLNGNKKRDKIAEKERLLQPVEVAPGLFFPFIIAEHWEQIKETRLDSIIIKATRSTNISFKNSSFGHAPYLPVNFPYPTDSKGKPMFPLAQINFSEVPPLRGYPTSGYLQIYVSANHDLIGRDFDDPQSQKDFRILFFEEHEISEHQKDFPFLSDMRDNGLLPLSESHSLDFGLKTEYVGLGDVRWENSGKFDIADLPDQYPIAAKELEEFVRENFDHSGHKIGGFACFTQEDPRIYNEKIKDYVLLLQIDTDEHIMWGDSGIGNFFIHPTRLAKKDFSKVVYNWDCC